MSANIEFNEKHQSYSFVESTLNETAWHRLGKQFNHMLTVSEAIHECNADFTVIKAPIVAVNEEMQDLLDTGTDIPAELIKKLLINNKKATFRTDLDKTLGIVSDQYGTVQNSEAFSFIDTLVSGKLSKKKETPVIECAGMLGNGERIFITAKFPETITINNDDLVDMYVVFTTSHDGSGSVNVMVTPIRVVCNNTLNLALTNNKAKLSFRHSSNVMNRLDLKNTTNAEMVYKTLGLYKDYKEFFNTEIKQLRNLKLSDKAINMVVAKTIMSPENFQHYLKEGINSDNISTYAKNRFDKTLEVINTGIGQKVNYTGTGLWVINGITTMYQNELKPKNDEQFLTSVSNGLIYNQLQKAHNAVYEYSQI